MTYYDTKKQIYNNIATPVVLVGCPLHPLFFDRGSDKFTIIKTRPIKPNKIPKQEAAEAIIVRSESYLNAKVLKEYPHLKLIIRAGTGLDNIDLNESGHLGIMVCNIPGRSSRDVAELAIGLCFALARFIINASNTCEEAGNTNKANFLGRRIHGLTLGIVGCGRIGSEVGQMGIAIGMNVLGVIQSPTPERVERLKSVGIKVVNMDEVLSNSDFVVICLPLTASTRGLFGKEKLMLMRKNSFLVNVSRAEILDEHKVLELLKEGYFAGVALDVYDSSLLIHKHSNLIRVPHIGAMTEEAQITIAKETIRILCEKFSLSTPNLC